MIVLISFLLFLSLIGNILLIWYVKKFVKESSSQVLFLTDQLKITSDNIDQMQLLFEEYSEILKEVYSLEEYHEDEIIKTVIGNTKMVIDMCKAYKKTIFSTNKEEEKPQDER